MSADDQRDGGERVCSPCRGTGQVRSSLGGTPSTVTCPWCEGSGRFRPEHDAQARWRSSTEAERP